MAQLRTAVEQRKNFIIRGLKAAGVKTANGQTLQELTLSDLERIYISVSCIKAKQAPLVQVM